MEPLARVIARAGPPGTEVTVTDSEKRTRIRITSAAMKAPLAPCPIPDADTPTTVGATVSAALPFTTAAPSVIAWEPRPSEAAFPASSRIVPSFSASAAAPMLNPLLSASAATTV